MTLLAAPTTPATIAPPAAVPGGLDLVRLEPGFGARVDGVDLSRATDDQVRAIRTALADHKVLFFSGQHGLHPDSQIALGRRLGEVTESHPVVPGDVLDREVGVVPEDGDHVVDVDATLPQRLAGVPGLEQGDVLAVPEQQVGRAAQDAGALGRGGARPLAGLERGTRRRHRPVDVVGPGRVVREDQRAVDRVEDPQDPAGTGVLPRPVDEQRARHGHGGTPFHGGRHSRYGIPMKLVGIVRLALVERRHVDLLRCASALCTG